jgi:hypothetical protein
MPLSLHITEEVVPYSAIPLWKHAEPVLPRFRWLDAGTAEGYVPAWFSQETIADCCTPFVSDTRDVTMQITRVTAIPKMCLQAYWATLPPEAARHISYREPTRLTVRDAINILAQQPPDALVYLEGCDCMDTMGGWTYDATENSVLLERTNGDTLHGTF